MRNPPPGSETILRPSLFLFLESSSGEESADRAASVSSFDRRDWCANPPIEASTNPFLSHIASIVIHTILTLFGASQIDDARIELKSFVYPLTIHQPYSTRYPPLLRYGKKPAATR